MERNYEERALCIGAPGNYLMGRVFLPKSDEPVPVAIFCHGFGANMYHREAYARKLATLGVAGVTFDFRGGGVDIESDGAMTDMSIRSAFFPIFPLRSGSFRMLESAGVIERSTDAAASVLSSESLISYVLS